MVDSAEASQMPLTSVQKDVMQVIAANRSEDSHFAGGLVLNPSENSPRHSNDFDIFHHAEEDVARASTMEGKNWLSLCDSFS